MPVFLFLVQFCFHFSTPEGMASQHSYSRDAREEKEFTLGCYLLPLATFFFPFSPHQRKMSFVFGVALASLSIYFFSFFLLPARKRVIMGLLLAKMRRVCVVLGDGRLMDSVGLLQWKFPILWYWSGSLEWSFYHSFNRPIKDFLFLSGNCISCSVFLIQVLHQSVIQCRFVVLERFTSGDEVSYSGLLSWPPWTLGKTLKLQFPSFYHNLVFWLLLELLHFFQGIILIKAFLSGLCLTCGWEWESVSSHGLL